MSNFVAILEETRKCLLHGHILAPPEGLCARSYIFNMKASTLNHKCDSQNSDVDLLIGRRWSERGFDIRSSAMPRLKY